MRVLHSIDALHVGGIADLILSLHEHSRHEHGVMTVAYGGLEPEMIEKGVKVYRHWPDSKDDYDVIVNHTACGWSSHDVFLEAQSRRMLRVEQIHSNCRPQTPPVDMDALIIPNKTVVPGMVGGFPNVTTLYDPIDCQSFWGLKRTGTWIGRCSRLAPEKGVYEFLKIAAAMPDHQFMMAGGGAAFGDLRNRATQNVVMPGWTRDFPSTYSQFGMFVFPTFDESYCRSIVMAMAAGIPIICSDLPALRETTQGLAIYCNSTQEFVDAIKATMSASKEDLDALSSALRSASVRYDLPITIGKWDDFLGFGGLL